ncbi:MAG: hypothetical protein PUB22_10290, partial [Clostridiales bacterium]|nr:hypothetical protein [Clostridiales bacterium]
MAQTGNKNGKSGKTSTSGTGRSRSASSSGTKNSSKTGTSKQSTSSRGAGSKQVKQRSSYQENGSGEFGREILLLILLAFCMILFLSNLELAGSVGTHLRKIQFGCFGWMAYLFPFYLFWIGGFLYSNRGRNGRGMVKLAASLAAFLALCGILGLLGGHGLEEGYTLKRCYAEGAEGLNGGWFGGLMYMQLVSWLG